MPSLLLYRNEDVHLEAPFKIFFSPQIDTLAELCAYVSDALPPADDPAGRGYRFLYSLAGKPLWRVKECIDAGTVVLSGKPGFLTRKTMATSDDAAAAKDVTPAGAQTGTPGNAVSQSPPAHQPDVHYAYESLGTSTGPGLGMSGSQPGRMGIDTPVSSYGAYNEVEGATRTVSIGRNGVPWMGAGDKAAARPSPLAETQRGAAGHSAGGGRAPAGIPPPEEGDGDAGHGKRLFTPESESQPNSDRPSGSHVPPPTELRGGDAGRKSYFIGPEPSATAAAAARSSYEPPMYGRGDAHPQATLSGRPVRGEVCIGGLSRPLPPAPQYTSVASLLSDKDADLPEDDENLLTGLRMYAARKWKGFSDLGGIPPTDIIAEDAMNDRIDRHLGSHNWPLRVIASGPPRSGISTASALALRAAINKSSRRAALYNQLLLVLDAELLFGDSMASAGAGASRIALLDIPFAFQIVIRAVLDAVSVQRSGLRAKGLVIAQLWDKLVTTNAASPPDFTAFTQVTSAVGHKVVAQWDRFACAVYPILQAARAGPSAATRDGAALRNAALDIIFYALPGVIASSLRFSGVLYALDGLQVLAGSHRSRVDRPVGDLGVLLKSLWQDENCHVIVAWPASVPLQSLYLPPPTTASPTLHIRTVGLAPTPSSATATASYQGPPLPQLIECQGKSYPIDVFLGCPGYLAPLSTLVRPLVGRSVPTTAFSTYSQHRKREKAAEPFQVRLDDPEVGKLLRQLEQIVAVAR